ncbi:DNA-processing protein DprA [Pyruvatibacter sp. HU-CL02332]|uniref:DNA-processing protein DprA n=1 Tax=Pyruvatibacter sp. HU-CL02332 TaxID=3127650 RepID=UPI0031091D45
MSIGAPWQTPQSTPELVDWLRLIRSQNIGPHTFWGLLSKYGSAAEALRALPELARRGRRRTVKLATESDAARELEQIDKYGAKPVAIGQSGYPPLLAQVESPPPFLTVMGDASIASARTIGIVGARNASASGRKMADLMAQGLGRHGVTISSGLARGVDTYAHKASLETGTVAVTAGGINRIYPKENTDLYHHIAELGAVVSEMPFDAEPIARFFPRRNRLISGMSAGVVVIEAAARSGSLITARFALEQGREVFAVPGSPLDQRAQGTNGLLRNGATLVQTPEDVLEGIESQFNDPAGMTFPFASATSHSVEAAPAYESNEPENNPQAVTEAILELLSPTPIQIDDLARLSGIHIAAVSAAVLELEIGGQATRHPGGGVSAE